jgi:integrase
MRCKLSERQVLSAKPDPDRTTSLADGGGLVLHIKPNGSKLWRYRYRYQGKANMLGLGRYYPGQHDHTGLARARELRDEAAKRLRTGADPSPRRTANGAAAGEADAGSEAVTFEKAARAWFADWAAVPGRAKDFKAATERRLERLLFQELGSLPISEIDARTLLQAIKKIEAGSGELARRMKARCGQIFQYAIAHGWCERDPSPDIRGGLRPRAKVRHRASLKASDLGDFLARLDALESYPITRLAIRFTLLTAARTNEVRFAVWNEFEDLDGNGPLWRIPAERMKMEKAHLVPLSRQAALVLRQARALYPESRIVFPSEESRSGFMSENAMLYALYRLGYKGKATVHGLRGTFSTVCNESGFNRDWVELCLAHTEKDEVRGAYNSASWLPQRRKLLQWWADYLEGKRGDK